MNKLNNNRAVFGAGYLGIRIAEELGFKLSDINVPNINIIKKYLSCRIMDPPVLRIKKDQIL